MSGGPMLQWWKQDGCVYASVWGSPELGLGDVVSLLDGKLVPCPNMEVLVLGVVQAAVVDGRRDILVEGVGFVRMSGCDDGSDVLFASMYCWGNWPEDWRAGAEIPEGPPPMPRYGLGCGSTMGRWTVGQGEVNDDA